MKARIKETGEIADIEFVEKMKVSRLVDFFKTSDGRRLPEMAIEFEKTIDWEQRRFELVKTAMSNLLGNTVYFEDVCKVTTSEFRDTFDVIAMDAIKLADYVCTRYKKGCKQ